LIGLGLGPGDKGLLTLRAVDLLRGADAVFVPGRRARDLVKDICEAEVLDFPMTNDEGVVQEALERNADRMAEVAANGTAVLGIIGDPAFYSTFSKQCAVLSRRHPWVSIRTEPGISSITAFASRAGISISGGFVVTDGPEPGPMVLLKVRRPRQKMEELRGKGFRHFILAENVFMEGERICVDDGIPEACDYFNILYAER